MKMQSNSTEQNTYGSDYVNFTLDQLRGCVNSLNSLYSMSKIEEIQPSEIEVPRLIGGPGSCWKWLLLEPHLSGDKVTVEDIVRVVKTFPSAFRNFLLTRIVVWRKEDDGDFHIVFACETEEQLDDAWDNNAVDGLYDERNRVTPFCNFLAEAEDDPTKLVASAVLMTKEAKRIGTAEIAKNNAAVEYNSEMAALPTVPLCLTDKQIAELAKYVGHPVRATHKRYSHNPHWKIACARHLARTALKELFPHNTDITSSLHIGCTMYEVVQWWAHAGHDFYFHLSEDKDVARMYSQLLKFIAARLKDKKLPALATQLNQPARVTFASVETLLTYVEQLEGRQRIFITKEIGRRYGTLFFEDCLYGMSNEEFADWFDRTNAVEAYSTLFVPDALIVPDAPPSDLYVYKEEIHILRKVKDFFDAVWPSVSVLGTFLPSDMQHQLAEFVNSFLHQILEKGFEWTRDGFKAVWNSAHPFLTCFGLAFEILKWAPIVEQIHSHFQKTILDEFLHVDVSWQSAGGNGYSHKKSTWKSYAVKRRFMRKSGLFVDSEVLQTHGEMWLTHFWSSTGSSPILYSLGLPKAKSITRVLDLFSCFSGGIVAVNPEKFSYLSIYTEDWQTLLLWCLAQPMESLDFEVVMTCLNRIRGGLALGSNVMVEAMTIESKDTKAIALAALLETCQLKQIANQLADSPELKKTYKSRIAVFAEMALKTGFIFSTGFLAVPVWALFVWMSERIPTIQFSIEPSGFKVCYEPAVESEISPKELLNSLTVVIPPPREKKIDCKTCSMQASGLFSEGAPHEGQDFFCLRPEKQDNNYDISFNQEEMVDLLGLVRTAKDFHLALNAKVTEHIRKLESWVDVNEAGVKKDVKVSVIRGGPGTGKSVIIRSLLHQAETEGRNAAVTMPFKALQSDYVNCEVLKVPGKHSFKSDTTWWTFQRSNVDTLIVDEATGMDYRIVKAMCHFLNVSRLILVGDESQTQLNEAAGEGINCFDERGFPMHKFSVHELYYNYRLPIWVTKYLNDQFGYRMCAKRADLSVPRIVSMNDPGSFDQTARDPARHRKMVFCHDSAEQVFGVTSSRDRESNENLSVRSQQGKTYDTAQISYTRGDVRVSEAHGMLCVAVSRSKEAPVFITTGDINDEFVQDLRRRLCLTTAEVERVRNLPWPDMPVKSVQVELTAEEDRLNRKILADTNVGIQPDAPHDKLLLDLPDVAIHTEKIRENKYPLMQQFRKIFGLCVIDLISSEFPQVRPDMYQMLNELYWGPRMPWLPGKGDLPIISQTPLRVMVPLEYIDAVLKEHDICMVGYKNKSPSGWMDGKVPTDQDRMAWYSERRTHVIPLRIVGEHATPFPGVLIPCLLPDRDEVIMFFRHSHIFGPNGEDYGDACDFVPTQWRGQLVYEPSRHQVKVPLALPPAGVFPKVLGALPPTYKKVVLPDMPFSHFSRATSALPLQSAWKSNPHPTESPLLPPIPVAPKVKTGKDCFRHASLIDPSGAVTNWPVLNPHASTLGHQGRNNIKVRPEGFLGLYKTKAGALKIRNPAVYRSVLPGMVHHFGSSPEDTITAAQRLGKRQVKPNLDAESRKWAWKVADRYYEENFKESRLSAEEANWILEGGLRAAVQRNYGKRAEADLKKDPTGSLKISVANKSIVKFKDPLKVEKIGQALSMSPPLFNLKWVPFMRYVNTVNKLSANDETFFDDYESDEGFCKRLSLAIQGLPESARFAISDAREFDSQQNKVTVEIEKRFTERLLGQPLHLEDYYQIREDLPYLAYGLFSGKMNCEKASGLPDTKYGNQTLAGALSNLRYTGVGPKVVAAKGDDYLRVQAGVKINELGEREIKRYTGMQLVMEVGDGGSFIGKSVSRKGCFVNVVQKALKVCAQKAANYEIFAQQQIAIRDSVLGILKDGLEETVGWAAEACGYTPGYAWACFSYLESMGHISKDQWYSCTEKRREPRYFLNKASGPTLL